MKPLLYFSALFFLIVTVSHAFRFDIITSENHDDHHHDHLIKSSSNGGDSLIRLPVEIGSKQQSQLETTTSNNNDHGRVTDVEQYLTELMNRRPVLLRNRFMFPRRCHHRFRRFGPGIQVGPKDDVASIFKKRAEVIRHRHVAGEFGGGEGEFFIVPVKHFHKMHLDHVHDHHHHDDRDHSEVVDPTVEMKAEEYEEKEEYDDDHHHHHHHDHDHHEHHDDHEENDIMKKIRKFLPFF